MVRGGGGAVDDRLSGFTWQDGERLIRFGRGAVAGAVDTLGGPGYTLLTTDRAATAAPHVVDAASAVHQVTQGLVENLAGDLRGEVAGERLVALGGGRVVDVAKALAAASGATAMAVPTTLSGAEMTRGHRHARGVDPATPRVRCAVVVNDPALSASQPPAALAASALNALGHAAEAPCTPLANPVATLAAHEAARLLVGALTAGRAAAGARHGSDRAAAGARPGSDRAGAGARYGSNRAATGARPGSNRAGAGARAELSEPDRDALALGALLAGYALDASAFGLHHVLAQSLVRVAGIDHATANAVMLPHSLGALAWRFPAQHETLAAALGEDPAEAAARLRAVTGVIRLSDAGVAADALPACADAAAARPELGNTPPRADRAEVLALYEHAY